MNIKLVLCDLLFQSLLRSYRVRTLTGKEIELDIEPDYKVCPDSSM